MSVLKSILIWIGGALLTIVSLVLAFAVLMATFVGGMYIVIGVEKLFHDNPLLLLLILSVGLIWYLLRRLDTEAGKTVQLRYEMLKEQVVMSDHVCALEKENVALRKFIDEQVEVEK